MTVRFHVLGFELLTVTLEFERHDDEPADLSRMPLKDKAKQAAGWWAIKR